jgi:tight adherence protein C
MAASVLRRAGHPGELSSEEGIALVLLFAVAFLAFGALAWICLPVGAIAVPGSALAGAAVPLLWLRDRTRARRAAIARALPYDLDLLTLSVEAGLDFAAALARVVDEGREGPLSDELSITLKELRLGKTREEALRGLAARVELPALTSFAHALGQADRMGTPLAKVLRVLSTQMRAERTQRAEKLAGEAPVKLLLPLIGCIFPTIFLMLFGPIAYQVFLGGDF